MKDNYSHYIIKRPNKISKETWKNIIDDIHIIFEGTTVPLAGFSGENDPIINEELLLFNGKGDEACENFQFKRNDDSRIEAIQTLALPYDIIVCCTFLILKRHLGKSFHFTTDGSYEDWKDAISCFRYFIDVPVPSVFKEQGKLLKVEAQLHDMGDYDINKIKQQIADLLANHAKNTYICVE